MKQNNPSEEQMRIQERMFFKGYENRLIQMALGRGKHVETVVSKNEDGAVVKIVTKTTPRKPYVEACKVLLDRYESEKKKLKRRVKK